VQVESQFQVYNASAGSGKTFTLVKEYLKILLSTDDVFRFQKILAITFTNKAAAEMKGRVLQSLKDFSGGEKNDMSIIILEELSLNKDILKNRSKRVLNSIVQNYSAFNITTIDSFTHRIIRNFAFDLGLSMNFDVEMDSISLLDEAVDLMISKIGVDKDLTKVLIDFSLEKTEDDKSWDIARELKEFAKVLLNENDVTQLKKLKNKTLQEFTALKSHLRKENKAIESEFVDIGKKGLEIIDSMNLEHNDFYRSMLPNHFKNLAFDFLKTKFFDQSKLRERIEENTFYSKSKSEDVKTAIEQTLPPLLEIYTQSEKLYQEFTRNSLVMKSLIPLAVLKHINASLEEIKEQNNLHLNAEFNQIISDQIRNEPAPFIYERLGEKYSYYFIDEMQDTSVLQWTNLIPLIENALVSETLDAEKGKLMLVGDAKQAIYRWRGGKAEQFINLTNQENPFSVDKSPKNLETNFRSSAQIVDFNNNFFSFVSGFLEKDDYRRMYRVGNQQKKNHKDEGFVQISFVDEFQGTKERDEVYGKAVLEKIQNLDKKYDLNDVCILVRTKKQGIAISNYLTNNKIDIVSSETLLLKNSKEVTFILDLLKFLFLPNNKEAAADFLYYLCSKNINDELKHNTIKGLIHQSNEVVFEKLGEFGYSFNENEFIQMPFYDSIEYIIRCFQLIKDSDAYILAFLDFVLEYQNKKGKGLGDFLENWDRKRENLSISIPEGKNAVNIMTIHKSKGLEFPVVIFPFDMDIYREINPRAWYDLSEKNEMMDFESTLVDYSKKLNYAGIRAEELYISRKKEKQLDNLNLLYVALTRPIEQLYVATERKSTNNILSEAKHFSDFFIEYLKCIEGENTYSDLKNEYNFGNRERFRDSKKSLETEIQEGFISSSWRDINITIATNSSLRWGEKQEEAINYGNLAHKILSKVKTEDDIESSIEEHVLEGNIDKKEVSKIRDSIASITRHPQLSAYFQENLIVFNEHEIMSKDKKILIPDRINFSGDSVTIIDYKTGRFSKKHFDQINDYAELLIEMSYKINKKILVYIDKNIVVKEVE
jgi:ATP-dependent exoDNAse (exonuclease V) beta subunit